MASIQNLIYKLRLTSIQSKLIWISAGITFVMLFSGLLTNFYINRINDFTKISIPINVLMDNVNNIQKAQKDFLIQDKNADEFMFRGTTKNVELVGKYFSQAFLYTEDISNDAVLNNLEDTTFLVNLNRIKSELSQFQSIFNTLLRKIEKRGSEYYGLVGEWTKTEKQLNSRVDTYQNMTLHDMFQDLRLLKAQYLISNDAKHIGEMKKINEKFSKILTDSIHQFSTSISQGELLVLAHSFEDFAIYGERLLALDSEIGFASDKGVIQDMYTISAKLEADILSTLRYVENTTNTERANAKRTLIILIFSISLFTILAFIFLSRTIISPIHKIEAFVSRLTKGELPDPIAYTGNDEIGDMLAVMNKFVSSLKAKAIAANEIGKGNLDVEIKAISENDILGNSLIEMQQSLIESRTEQLKRKKEEETRQWTTEGLALFADIMRKDTDNLEKLSRNIISTLVKYINAIQGAIFLINENDTEDIHIELITAFAYDRHRNIEKRIELEEGLIGRCIEEKEKIYMTKVPQGYTLITSGLGEETPDALLIVPLKSKDVIFGAVEIAGFREFAPHIIDFVEKIAEDIASVIASAKINQRTAFLLQQTKQQAEEMAAQEEELRQNLEELQTTQEESARKEAVMDSLMASIDASTYAIETDVRGRILKVNPIVINTHKRNEEHLIGSLITEYIANDEVSAIESAIAEVNHGITVQRITRKKSASEIIWMKETYAPIFDNNQQVERILNIAFDITEMKKLEEELKEDNERIKYQEEILRKTMLKLQEQEIDIKNQLKNNE